MVASEARVVFDDPEGFCGTIGVGVEQLIAAGVDAIQLRDKQLADRQLLSRAKLLRELTAGLQTLFIMNDRADLACLSDADGVHVGQEELDIQDVRVLIGPEKLVGVSTHSLQQALDAERAGADYIGCGPVFPSATKGFERLAGLQFLRAAIAKISTPAFAIGGITAENVPQVLETGFTRVAVQNAVWEADDCGAAADRFREVLQR